LRDALVVLGASGVVGVLVLGLWVPLSDLRDDEQLALLAPPGTREALLTAVQLARPSVAFSESLVLAQARTAAQVAGRIPVAEALPLRSLRRIGVAAFVAVLAAATSALGWPAATARGLASLVPPLLTPQPTSTAAEGPLVGDLSLEYEFPEYMIEPPLVVPSTSGEIAAPRGTVVTIRTRSLLPIRSGSILLEDGRSLPLHLDGSRRIEGRLLVDGPGRYAFRIEPDDASPVRERGWRTIRATADEAPIVTLTAPEGDAEVEPGQKVDLAYDLRDDHGLRELVAVLAVGSDPEVRRPIRSFDAGVRDTNGVWQLALDEVRMDPGEAMAVHLEAFDRDTISGPNRGSSRTVTLRVASPASRHLALIEDQKVLLDLVVGALGERLERPVPEEGLTARAQERFGIVRAAQDRIVTWVREHEDAILRDTLARGEPAAQIAAMRDRLSDLLQREWHLHAGILAPRARRLELDREQIKELEDDALMVEDLLGGQRLDALAELGREVDRSRERLKSLLAQFARGRSEQVRRQLLREIATLEQQVRALDERLAQMQRDVPQEFLNANALQAMDLEGALRDLRESLASDDVAAAQAALDRLSENMRQLMAALEGNASAYRGERSGAEERARSELLDRVGDLERRERDLSRLTRAVQERYRRQLADSMRTRIDPLVQRLLARTRTAAHSLEGADPATLAQFQSEDLSRVRQRVSDLEASLAQGDLDEAAEMADRALEGLQSLDENLGMARAGTRPTAEAIEGAIPPIRSVRQELQHAMPSPGQMLGDDDAGRLRRQGSSQRTLGEDASRLAHRIARPDSGLPFVARDAQRLLEDARTQMQQAADQLGRANPREAFDAQDRALERLRRVRETLEEAGQPRSLAEGMRQRSEPVRIPGPEEHQVPREFRREVLDAMRERPGDQEDEAVRRYYEELVR
jgi:uncharacterized protein DUF4175